MFDHIKIKISEAQNTAETKLKDKELYAAIGWLSREGKLNVVECKEEKELYLSLVK